MPALLLASSALLSPIPATAQSVAPTRDELSNIAKPEAPPRPSLNVVGGIERSPCPLADPRFADVKVTISEVQFNGLKGATPEEMRAAWSPFAGREQPVSVLCEIRDAAATILRDKGYLAAVQVPTQRIENGVVTMETLYARVTTVRARGQTDGAEAKLAGYLNKLTEDEYFDRNKAERYLLLARDIPGYNVQLTLKPAGTGPGELIGEVAVLRRRYSLDATVQNLAAQETGRWGGQVRGQLYGLTGLGDVTTLAFYSTADFKEQKILQLGHSFRPGSEGLVIDGQFTYAWTKPDIDAGDATPELKAKTLFWTLGARRQRDGEVPTERQLALGCGADDRRGRVAVGPARSDRVVAFRCVEDVEALAQLDQRIGLPCRAPGRKVDRVPFAAQPQDAKLVARKRHEEMHLLVDEIETAADP